MNRIQEKVKDIVEVRPYRGLRDFSANAQETLENYCFTDDTSDLMAKWINAATTISPQNGAALALAGYRGVGKSHFLAAFSSIVAFPELRSKVSNSHVAAASQGLLRRHYPLVNVRRGLKENLLEELQDGVRSTFGPDVVFDGPTLDAILSKAVKLSGDLPLLLMIDTAIERGSRVARNDGALLGEIAEFAKSSNMIVCVALDDDIAGADGSNAAIVRTYKIDYLDQEHLYKVVNTHIFPKNNSKEAIVNDIYQFFSKVVPNFRWSAQRFTSLYPLHPGIVEVAPYIRLYVHDFALLSFAAEAGERILGRPANSLIAFDEVFDKAESNLRKIEDLADAFTAYDRLNSEVISKIPVIQRLQAKLILKALLLLSLNGRGASAEDICSSMLIFDENEPEKAAATVKGIIELFSQALPEDITTVADESGETLFSFRVRAKENINNALQDAVASMDRGVISSIVRSVLQEKYADFTLPVEFDAATRRSMESVAAWRGSIRRGRVIWLDEKTPDVSFANEKNEDIFDWEVVIDLGDGSAGKESAENTELRAVWRPDAFTSEETDTLLKHYLLQTENDVVDKYGEHVRASIHSHRMAAERIVERAMLANGNLSIEGFDYNFTDEARSADTLADLFSVMLEPLFETRFPLHPHFNGKLGMAEVSRLVSDLYTGSRQNLEDVQHLARSFSFPLGLVRFVEGKYVPEAADNLEKLPGVVEILKLVNSAEDSTTSLRSVYAQLRQPPYGLVREAQHLILAALVAERKIEFVTSKGDRINSRSLDLRIIWDDIVGVAKPGDSVVSTKRLIVWAQTITGDRTIRSLNDGSDQEKLRTALNKWLEEWDTADLVGKVDRTRDDQINTKIWSESSRLKKSFGVFADEIRGFLAGNTTLDAVLSRLSDVFLDSDEEYLRATQAATVIENYLAAVELRTRVGAYLTASEPTGNIKLEEIRQALIVSLERAVRQPAEARNREAGYLWEQFRRGYSEIYSAAHDLLMRSHDLQEKFDEILRTDIWWEFKNLSEIEMLVTPEWTKCQGLLRQLENLDCGFDVKSALNDRPVCLCEFRLGYAETWRDLPETLWAEISKGQAAVREILRANSVELVNSIKALTSNLSDDDNCTKAAAELAEIFRKRDEIPHLKPLHLEVLKLVLTGTKFTNGLRTNVPGKDSLGIGDSKNDFHQNEGEDVDDLVLMEI